MADRATVDAFADKRLARVASAARTALKTIDLLSAMAGAEAAIEEDP